MSATINNTLMIYRIMYDTNSMNADTDYIEMAQLLGDAGLPGEAQRFCRKAMSSGTVKDEHKERTKRLLNSLKTRADSDKKGLAAARCRGPEESGGTTRHEARRSLFRRRRLPERGNRHQSRPWQGTGIKQMDEAYVYLGRAQVALKNYAEAKKAFEKLKTVPNISPRVLKLCELYSDKLGS